MATGSARHRLMTETYQDVERLIWDVVHKFYAKHGPQYGDRQELFSEACIGFMIAYRVYNPAKGSFPTYVRMVANHTLLEHMRNETKRRVRLDTTSELEPVDTHPTFSVAEFLDEVSEDAKTIVMLILDTPNDLLHAMQHEQEEYGVKYLLRQYLSGMGWAAERITQCFAEIAHAL
jgi:RNA polymerase sigma factor (sigma-70 family)